MAGGKHSPHTVWTPINLPGTTSRRSTGIFLSNHWWTGMASTRISSSMRRPTLTCGLAGWNSWRGGSASGTGLGRKVAGALARLFDQDLTNSQRGALIGAVDGGLFLGLTGTVLGLIASYLDVPPQSWLLPLFSVALL